LRELKSWAEDFFSDTVDRAVITVPAYFNDAQRQATRDAGRLAGLEVLRLVNEPTAAALAYGLHQQKRGRVAVYDFGGGTFDISILKLISTDEGDIYQVLSTGGTRIWAATISITCCKDAQKFAPSTADRPCPRPLRTAQNGDCRQARIVPDRASRDQVRARRRRIFRRFPRGVRPVDSSHRGAHDGASPASLNRREIFQLRSMWCWSAPTCAGARHGRGILSAPACRVESGRRPWAPPCKPIFSTA
jgi:hypothetical protein